jgi:hypothetical protein
MGSFRDGRWKYIGGGKGSRWKMIDTHDNHVVRTLTFKEMRVRFKAAYERKLINKVMRRQGMKGKNGRKVAKGLVKAYRLGIIDADALY